MFFPSIGLRLAIQSVTFFLMNPKWNLWFVIWYVPWQGKEDIHKQQDEADQGDQGDLPHARFQRTDQWIPVYSWLESLQQDEVVKSKEISDWLTENPTIRDQLCSRHSRYHLMHYIKKCHLKILKRKEKKKVSIFTCHTNC